MSKILIFITGILLSTYVGFAQKPIAKFNKETINIGSIKEDNGAIDIKFSVKNIGKSPLIINNIESSCGCTTPLWNKKPILPNSNSYIIARLNPANRSGAFIKTITVYSNATSGTKKLYIKGSIIPHKKTVNDIYKYCLNGLRFKRNHIPLLNIKDSQVINTSVEAINTSKKPIIIKYLNNLKHISIDLSSNKIMPNKKLNINIRYNTLLKHDWGFSLDTIKFKVNNKEEKLLVSATISEDFSKLSSKEYNDRPIIKLSELSYFFNDRKDKKEIKHYFYITNEGNSDLIIHKIKPSSSDLHISCKSKKIKSKQTIRLDYIYDIKSKSGIQNKKIIITSNAPDSPVVKYSIKGSIKRM